MRWLHISDIHYNPKMDGRTAEQLRGGLPTYLESLRVTVGKVDEVFITGDFRHAGRQEDTDETACLAVDFVKKIAGAVGITDVKNIHIVPGNHDLERCKSAEEKRKLNKLRENYDAENGKFAEKDEAFLLNRFSFFKRVCEKLYDGASPWPDTMQPVHICRSFERYHLLYLNTALISNDDAERGQLVIGSNALYHALEKAKATNPDIPVIVLAHHGMLLLSQHELKAVEELFNEYPVRLYLCGDSHKIWHRKLNNTIEITMGCLTQQRETRAVFSIGELRADGHVSIKAYHWDGMWTEYAAFNESISQLLPAPPPEPETPKVFGRDALIDDLHSRLMRSGREAVGATGPPGVGKTTICREVMRRVDPARRISIDLTQQFNKADALTVLLRAFAVDRPQNLEDEVKLLYGRYAGHVVYLDNLEDPLIDPAFKAWLDGFINDSGFKILFSSRKALQSGLYDNETILPLDIDAARDMFLNLWEKPVPEKSQHLLVDLLEAVDCHPLSIKLVAAQRWKYPTVSALLNAWRKQESMELADDTGKHGSLKTAVRMSYEAVKDNREALTLWGVMSFVPAVLSRRLFETMFSEELEAYEKAAELMLKNSLMQPEALEDGDSYGYSMLRPIKEMAFAHTEAYRETSASLLCGALITVFSKGDDRTLPDRSSWHLYSLECLPVALAFLHETKFSLERNYVLISKMRNYFQYSPQTSLELLKILEGQEYADIFFALLCEKMGDMERYWGQIDNAREHYTRAEDLYRNVEDEYGLANVFQSMASLECQLGQFDEAREHYTQAENLSRKLNYDLGLANALLGMGDLERANSQFDEAREHYTRAESLYRDLKDNLGLANVFKGMGYLEQRRKNLISACKLFLQALSLYKTELDARGTSYTLGELCLVCSQMGNRKESEAYREKAVKSLEFVPENMREYVEERLAAAAEILAAGGAEKETANP